MRAIAHWVEFADPGAAVLAGIGFQREVEVWNRKRDRDRRMRFRVGINLGTAIVEGGNLLGDCVNVAARLESLSEPGGLCISGTVYEQVKETVTAKYDSLGDRRLKNIADPVRAYRVRIGRKRRSIHRWGEGAAAEGLRRARGHVEKLRQRAEDLVDRAVPSGPEVDEPAGSRGAMLPQGSDRPLVAEGLALPNRPSVAVLPFAGSDDEPGLRYGTDLLTERLIEALARVPGLFVIAPYSSFALRTRDGELAVAGRRLGVRHLVVGQVRIVGDRLHTTVQMVDRTVGTADWEGAFAGRLDELPRMVGEIWPPVARRLGIADDDLPTEEAGPPDNLDAYAYVQRAQQVGAASNEEANQQAKGFLRNALDRDPGYARGHSMLARVYLREAQLGWGGTAEDRFAKATEAAESATRLDPLLPAAHVAEANVALWMKDHDRAAKACDRALTLVPNDADALETMGAIAIWSGHPGDAIGTVKQAMRLDPLNPMTFLFDLGHAYFCLGHYEDAISAFLRGTIGNPAFTPNHLYLASAHGHLRESAEAERAIKRCREYRPGVKLNALLGVLPYMRLEDTDRLRDGLHKAGLTR